ncbi:hypothetical protein Tco_1106375 [Tanacetum coccineum]
MVPPNNLGPDLNGKAINETQYRGMIRSLMYLTVSKPNIQFSTCLCARYQANPKESNLIVVKRIFRYLKGTPGIGLWYPKYLSFDLKGYSDSDYAGCNMDKKSTSGACQLLGGKFVCWSAKKQQFVAMFSADAEDVAAAGFLHSRTKHIDIRYHFIRDHILKGDNELHFIPTQYQLADIFTKPIDEPTFKRLIVKLEDLIHKLNKKTREKIVPYPMLISLLLEHMEPKYDNKELTINPTQVFSVHNWILMPNQPKEPPFTDHMKAIYNLDVLVDFKAPKYSSPTEEVPQDKKPGARSRLRRKQSSKHTSESTTKASKS